MVLVLDLIELDKFRNGDEAILKKILAVIKEPLYSFSKRLIRDPDDAQDIVAETIESLWDYRAKIENPQHIINYVYQVAGHKIVHFIKKFPDRLTPLYYQLPALLTEPQLAMLEDELTQQTAYWAARAQHIIDNIPYKYAEVFKLHLQGKKEEEIAIELKKSPYTVRNQIAWMRDKVAQMLLEEGFPRDLLILFFLYFLS